MLLILALLAGGVWWMVGGPAADTRVVNNANVVAAVVAIVTLLAAVAALRRPDARDTGVLVEPAALSAEQEQLAVDRLAREMTWVWRQQAQLHGIRRTVAPVVVRWRWARADIAAPPEDFQQFAADQRVVVWRTDTGQLTGTACLAHSYRTDPRYVDCR